VGLTHYDFWSGNVVWEDEVLTGVVDWTNGSLGPPGFDIGWWTWVPNYHDLGRTDLTATELRNRHTSWTEHLLAKIAASI
jgi:aminoglycoside phosphotransferase (APT) family kinase protein